MLVPMNKYIRYYFQKRIVNLKKTKKADLKTIISPLLVEYYEKYKATTDVAYSMYLLAEDNVTFTSGILCRMGDNSEGLSDQDI